MGFYENRVLPRMIDFALGTPAHQKVRRRVASGLEGVTVEVGFGSGLNVPWYPAAVKSVWAVDPALRGRDLAAERLAESPTPVEFAGLDGQRLVFEDQSADTALSTWTLCTIPDVDMALAEIRRVLKPGGRLHFVEHGLSPEAGVAKWQRRLNGAQMWWAGGCQLQRQIATLVEAAGFELEKLDNYYMKGPRFMTYMYEGVATLR